MSDALFHIIALAVAALGVVRGYRRGLTGMVTSVLGMAFGVVCAHIFCDALGDMLLGVIPPGDDPVARRYLALNLGCGIVFFSVYFIFRTLTRIIRDAMSSEGNGLLNSLMGTVFCVFNYLLMLSIAFNIGVGLDPSGPLMRFGKADDGNIISAVMWMAPACLGSGSFAEFAHLEQLRDARKISVNRCDDSDVITICAGTLRRSTIR